MAGVSSIIQIAVERRKAISTVDAVIEKFNRRDAHVAVIGLGYVGLPLAVSFADAGYCVTGIDLDARKVDAINRGESYIEDVPSAAIAVLRREDLLQRHRDCGEAGQRTRQGERESHHPPVLSSPPLISSPRGLLAATTDYSVLETCDAVSICVPTPLNKTGDPDISYIVYAAEQIARYLHPGMVIVLESTTYPGTTTEVMLPILSRGEGQGARGEGQLPAIEREWSMVHQREAGWRVGEDFYLAFSPERVDPGRTDWTTRNTPKVIGGVTPACCTAAMAFYQAAVQTLVPVASP